VHFGGPLWKNREAGAWSVPKGEYEPGADPETEAAREFQEELGVPAPQGPRIDLGSVRQASGKQVRVWAIEANDLVLDQIVSNEFEMEWPPKSGRLQRFPEVDRAEWMTIVEARGRITKAQEEFFDRLDQALDQSGR
jgi:predicted NUDIX family NTP pyrophosphohydrolase